MEYQKFIGPQSPCISGYRKVRIHTTFHHHHKDTGHCFPQPTFRGRDFSLQGLMGRDWRLLAGLVSVLWKKENHGHWLNRMKYKELVVNGIGQTRTPAHTTCSSPSHGVHRTALDPSHTHTHTVSIGFNRLASYAQLRNICASYSTSVTLQLLSLTQVGNGQGARAKKQEALRGQVRVPTHSCTHTQCQMSSVPDGRGVIKWWWQSHQPRMWW